MIDFEKTAAGLAPGEDSRKLAALGATLTSGGLPWREAAGLTAWAGSPGAVEEILAALGSSVAALEAALSSELARAYAAELALLAPRPAAEDPEFAASLVVGFGIALTVLPRGVAEEVYQDERALRALVEIQTSEAMVSSYRDKMAALRAAG